MSTEQNVNPGINDHYQGALYEDWVGVFESAGRDVFDRRFQVIAASAVKPGMVVADIGAGTGLYTRLFARAVRPGGKVYAVDIARDFVENIERSAEKQGLNNVQGVVNSQKETGLPAESIDLAFICDTYHHFEYPRAMLASIHQALKPGAELVVVDFELILGKSSSWVISHVRAGKEEVIAEIQAAGFELIEDNQQVLRNNYFLRFRKLPDIGS
jgi:predicted methyltransferase